MSSSKLKRSIATVASIACVLGAAGPASASSAQRLVESQFSETKFMDYTDDALLALVSATGLKYETEVTDYLHRGTASGDVRAVHAGGGWDPLGHHQHDLDPRQAPTSTGFWLGSNDALGHVTDGTSNTMLFGERAATAGGRAAEALKIGGAEAAGF